ncbi:hypothetical protein [Fluviibacterium sp. S390]|uniref:hypothetical protein n=1 Tax=Fluviibacterium sp. S390 TaxID=3415139 RepID=UPI003C7E3379
MKIKTAIVALALATLPGLAVADYCQHGKEQRASSCAQGSTWDSATQRCTPGTTS